MHYLALKARAQGKFFIVFMGLLRFEIKILSVSGKTCATLDNVQFVQICPASIGGEIYIPPAMVADRD